MNSYYNTAESACASMVKENKMIILFEGNTKKGITLLELVIVLGIFSILGGTVFSAAQAIQRRNLNNASLTIQADIRRAQRMAVIEGRAWRITFDVEHNRYSVAYLRSAAAVIDTSSECEWIYLPSGVEFKRMPVTSVGFLPRGTLSGGVSGSGFTMHLQTRQYAQKLTILPVTGRVRIFDIERLLE